MVYSSEDVPWSRFFAAQRDKSVPLLFCHFATRWDEEPDKKKYEQVLDMQTREPLRYNKRDLLNPFFIVE